MSVIAPSLKGRANGFVRALRMNVRANPVSADGKTRNERPNRGQLHNLPTSCQPVIQVVCRIFSLFLSPFPFSVPEVPLSPLSLSFSLSSYIMGIQWVEVLWYWSRALLRDVLHKPHTRLNVLQKARKLPVPLPISEVPHTPVRRPIVRAPRILATTTRSVTVSGIFFIPLISQFHLIKLGYRRLLPMQLYGCIVIWSSGIEELLQGRNCPSKPKTQVKVAPMKGRNLMVNTNTPGSGPVPRIWEQPSGTHLDSSNQVLVLVIMETIVYVRSNYRLFFGSQVLIIRPYHVRM